MVVLVLLFFAFWWNTLALTYALLTLHGGISLGGGSVGRRGRGLHGDVQQPRGAMFLGQSCFFWKGIAKCNSRTPVADKQRLVFHVCWCELNWGELRVGRLSWCFTEGGWQVSPCQSLSAAAQAIYTFFGWWPPAVVRPNLGGSGFSFKGKW